jgi:hypothetical protein
MLWSRCWDLFALGAGVGRSQVSVIETLVPARTLFKILQPSSFGGSQQSSLSLSRLSGLVYREYESPSLPSDSVYPVLSLRRSAPREG